MFLNINNIRGINNVNYSKCISYFNFLIINIKSKIMDIEVKI